MIPSCPQGVANMPNSLVFIRSNGECKPTIVTGCAPGDDGRFTFRYRAGKHGKTKLFERGEDHVGSCGARFLDARARALQNTCAVHHVLKPCTPAQQLAPQQSGRCCAVTRGDVWRRPPLPLFWWGCAVGAGIGYAAPRRVHHYARRLLASRNGLGARPPCAPLSSTPIDLTGPVVPDGVPRWPCATAWQAFAGCSEIG